MAPKPGKPLKVKARQPRGFGDRGPADLRAQGEMIEIIKGVYERYGFEPVETPMFEYTDALGKFLPDSDRPNEGVFSLQDDDEEWLSLRYDLTAPLARHVAENFNDIALPYRSYRAGYVFRNEKPGPGRFRQFMQFDADSVGSPGVSADAEMCMMMADVMEALGIERGQYVIRVNNRKVLDGVLEAIGLGGDENAERRLTVLRALDKLDKFGIAGVRELLGKGRLDESGGKGDFTKGAELDADSIDRVLRLFDVSGLASEAVDADGAGSVRLAKAREAFGENARVAEGLGELETIRDMCRAAGYDDARVSIDTSVVRGLEYYTGPVYEAELLFDVTNEKGVKVQFGSVGGGGRYDGLIARFRGEAVPATGFSIGVSRLQTALKNLGRLKADERTGPVVVTVMDRDRLADYQRLTVSLREGLNPRDAQGRYTGSVVPVEMFQGNPKQFGKQLQYADRRNAPCVVIQGGDEKAAGTVQVKDLVEGKRLSETIEDNATWRASRPAQVTVPEAELVAAVRAILDAQAADRLSSAAGASGEKA
ncbi:MULTISPECIES: histidine--tRNA ligase [unclassified Aureimonas]|uniref:histidine--tRNA ligase n=1 Tax=unclassified Aureimonas TaxID=2615206 RepID=UPI0006F41546|nr:MULTISPECIES: histidine--tRNA ligase [unclassified Aureimonas]KQT69751.1 histidine--tRNA ligase [Aureimonas sp. Leaf427]KQT76097.1 histidine--tRNA ligase [Aureimonas sp. Leaf460]